MDVRSKTGDTTASVLHDRGKPPDPLNSFANKPTDLDGSDNMNEPVGEELPTPGTAPIRGIGLRVTNIEGNPLLPRRGMFSTSNVSVLDGLMSISKPVENPFTGESSSMANKDNGAAAKPLSYAESVSANTVKKVNFRSLASSVNQEGCDVVLPRESVRSVQDKMANTLYGYFLGDRVAFPVVDYFVCVQWKKYGLQKTMMNANGFFFFKFKDENGMANVMKDGPWIVRSQPLFLNNWTPTTKLEKKEVKKVQLWVKIHEVPIAAYTEDGLSLIATTIGEPKMLDSFTTSMCLDSWGRSSYARALIEISADKEFREEITMAIPESEGEGFVKETMYVEYEWSPHRCPTCCVFGHNMDSCPKQPTKPFKQMHEELNRNVQKNRSTKKTPVVDKDGYTEVHGKKIAKKVGTPVNKQKPRFEYRPIGPKPKGDSNKASSSNSTRSNNPFDILNEEEADLDDSRKESTNSGRGNDDSNDDVEEVYTEMDEFMTEGTLKSKPKGASTPSPIVKMVSIATWKIRGLNRPLKQKEVRQAVKDFKLSLCVILESHVDVSNLSKVCNSIFRSWDWTSNGGCCDKGTRIIIGWNPAIFDVMILSQSPQVMHIQLVFKIDKRMVFCSFVYADNYYVSRKELWHNLLVHKILVGNKPWCIMGDFNTALNLEDNSMGSSIVSIGMRDFQECVDEIEVVDINRTGMHFTWSQKPKNGVGLMKKIDRVMGNTPFIADYPNYVAFFKPYRLSDHCPCILSFPGAGMVKPKPFKFANFLVFKPEFLDIVKSVWDTSVSGVHQFRVVKKLRMLKHPLRSLLFKQGNLHKKVETLRLKLDEIQQSIDRDPNNVELQVAEREAGRDLLEASLDEERFLKQKSKVDWLRAGDSNSAFFHSSLKIRNHFSRIDVIKDPDGNLYEGDAVFQPFVNHYQKFFGSQGDISLSPAPDLFSKIIDPQKASHMIRPITVEEVKKRCKLLQELNHTTIVLIPKVPTPATVVDYRPIACCNSCSYPDTVDWRFLKSVLLGFGFHANMVNWIMALVSTDSFSVCVNGSVHGFFKGSRELRQGDPISPYLFTLVMEVLTAILLHAVRIDSSFKFHNKCEKQQIINLCFADDLFIFARGEVNSARCVMTSLSMFTRMSGLVPSNQKSTIFFCNVNSHVKDAILNIMPFVEGKLPVRYFGVPLISSRLGYNDCRVLIERLEKRITNWRNKLLSFAGRLQLIISVLSSMHIYWASVFILPARITQELEARMRNFLWSQESSFNKGKSKVSWKTVCTPKYEGGLGIRRIGDMNKALMASHIWSIVSKRASLWVEWVHSYHLKGRSFWVCKTPANCCWSWRKLIQLRPLIRKHIWSVVGNGTSTSAWYDFWCDPGPLSDFLTPRTITDADFKLDDSVANVYSTDSWRWPTAWRDLFPVLIQLDQMQLNPAKQDRLLWKDGTDLAEFSSSNVWHSVRYKEPEVNWCNIVWFSQCIPRHAFMLWLVMKGKLLTQDKILKWDISRRKNMNMMCCLLCYENFDSHPHLFFECKFSSQVWHKSMRR
ncbi:uncharacterized protein LOC110893399 [Helianthus annuus]|uniref:uncharacterized protein LOC110893399 n=1 Tax=Helianthus annuus TaxID=4232 RepID=UPI000B9098EA|nr:uncharacterized protein LOC110893399 [Helianthus annuus]